MKRSHDLKPLTTWFSAFFRANVCPHGTTYVASELECRSAAYQLSGKYMGNGSWHYVPRGCYTYKYGASRVNQFFLNTHPTGNAQDTTQSICIGSSSTNMSKLLFSKWEMIDWKCYISLYSNCCQLVKK